MSRIGKKTIIIPAGVDVSVNGATVTVKGGKGQLTRTFPSVVDITIQDGILSVALHKEHAGALNMWGLTRALIANMIQGVHEGYEKVLEFSGVGYKAQVKGDGIELNLGFSHPVFVRAPEGIAFKAEKNSITISGVDKELIGHVAATIRKFRPPEPYQGTGIKYRGEFIRRKAGKKAGSA